MSKIDTGAVGTVKVPALWLGPGAKTRTVKPVALAVHEGEDPEDVRAFAAELVRSWEARCAKRRAGWMY